MNHSTVRQRLLMTQLIFWLGLLASHSQPADGQPAPPPDLVAPCHSWRVVTIEGDAFLATALDWPGADQLVSLELADPAPDANPQPKSIPFDWILEIVPNTSTRPKAAGPAAGVIVFPLAGGTLQGTLAAADQVKQAGGRAIRLQHDLIGPLAVPLEAVAAIRFVAATDDRATAAEFDRRLREAHETQDTLLVRGPGGLTAVSGALESLTANEWRFTTSGRDVRGGLEKLAGIVLAKPKPTEATIGSTVQFDLSNGDGLRGGTLLRFTAQTAVFRIFDSDLTVDWRRVSRVSAASDRVAFISDLEPTQYQCTGYFGEQWPLCRDKTPFGQPIEIVGRRYGKGLGLRPGAIVTYAIPPGFTRLAGIATVSASSPSLRAAPSTLAIQPDDPAHQFSQVLRPGIAQPVQIELGSSRTLSIRIERGADASIGTHVLLANLRFIR